MDKDLIIRLVTKELLAQEFAKLLVNGGWRPSLMPTYIENVVQRVIGLTDTKLDYYKLKRDVINIMKKLDPVLFKRDI